jgi:hypothetical protein
VPSRLYMHESNHIHTIHRYNYNIHYKSVRLSNSLYSLMHRDLNNHCRLDGNLQCSLRSSDDFHYSHHSSEREELCMSYASDYSDHLDHEPSHSNRRNSRHDMNNIHMHP